MLLVPFKARLAGWSSSRRPTIEEQEPGQSEDDYDPHLHRVVSNPISNTVTLIHILKGCLGTGELAMPDAFRNAGMVNGLVSTLFIGILCTHCLHILMNVRYDLCKRLKVPGLTYSEALDIALLKGPECLRRFAGFASYMVDILLVIYQFGVCCIYIIFVGVSLKDFVDVYLDTPLRIELYMLMTVKPFVIMISVRDLNLIAPFSLLANILMVVSFGIVFYYVSQDLPDIRERPAFAPFNAYPLYFGTTLYSFECVGVAVAVQKKMRTPKDFGGWFGVLNSAMFLVTMFNVSMGFLGYWKYGDDTKGSITMNFPPDEILVKVVKILYAIAIYLSYSLAGYIPVEIIWENYLEKRVKSRKYKLLWEYVVRISSVLLTFALAAAVPLLARIISLFGAFTLPTIGLAFPALMEICVQWPKGFSSRKIVLIKDIMIITLSVSAIFVVSITTVIGLVQTIMQGGHKDEEW